MHRKLLIVRIIKELLGEGNKLRQKSLDAVNSIYRNTPPENSENENPNIIRDNNASADHDDNLQNGEIEEQRPNLSDNINANESESNEDIENTASREQFTTYKDNNHTYVKTDNRDNAKQNLVQNNE